MADKNILSKISDIIFPRGMKCLVCGEEIFNDYDKSTCDKCESNLPFNNGAICKKCGRKLDDGKKYCKHCKNKLFYFQIARSPFVFKDEMKNIVHRMKYDNHKYLFQPFAKYICDEIVSDNIEFDVVIPVPLHKKRLKNRGYNQAELLAREIAINFEKPLITDGLERVKETKSQTKLDYSDRQMNLADAFVVKNDEYIKKKKVLLVDDVKTTGATIEECSQVLFNAGANQIIVVTLCSTNPDDKE